MNAFKFFGIDETQCFDTANSGPVIVSFRGTEVNRIQDWVTDIGFDLVNGPLGDKVTRRVFRDAKQCMTPGRQLRGRVAVNRIERCW